MIRWPCDAVLHVGDVEAALKSYARSAVLAPDQAQTFYDWGWLLQQKGDAAGAMDKYRAAIEREPKHSFAYYKLGYLMQSACDVTGAQIVYEPAPVVRAEVLQRYPSIAPALARVFGSLNMSKLQALNAQIAVEGQPARGVAQRYLEQEGLLN